MLIVHIAQPILETANVFAPTVAQSITNVSIDGEKVSVLQRIDQFAD
jgi:hypothetical protein